MKYVVWPVVLAFLALSVWTVYANVLSDDSAVRAKADKLAREAAGCGDSCKLVRMEGSRGVFAQTITFRFTRPATVVVTCKRPYIAFGAYACTATKQ